MRTWAVIGVGLAVLVGLAGFWAASSLQARPSYVVGETELIVDNRAHEVTWLDDQTVVFVGEDKKPGQTAFDYGPGRAKIQVWRLGEAPSAYAADRWPTLVGDARTYVCAADGQIRYAVAPLEIEKGTATAQFDGKPLSPTSTRDLVLSWKQKILQGPLGHEVEAWRSMPAYSLRGQIRFPVNAPGGGGVGGVASRDCDHYADARMDGRLWAPNRRKTAYLDMGAQGEFGIGDLPRFTLESADGATRTVFEGPFDHIVSRCLDTPAWEDSFILYNCSHGWNDETRAAKVLTVYRLDVARRALEPTAIQNSPVLWGADIGRYRDGYFVAANAAPSDEPERHAGLYVVRDGKPERLLAGRYHAPSVSPDGCRVAVLREHTPPGAFAPLANLVVVDLCQVERERRARA
jgi:hypothetical protein